MTCEIKIYNSTFSAFSMLNKQKVLSQENCNHYISSKFSTEILQKKKNLMTLVTNDLVL